MRTFTWRCDFHSWYIILIYSRFNFKVFYAIFNEFFEALWFHNVVAEEFSIGVNVFWRHLDESLYEKKDVYGNKDLLPAKKAIEFTDKSIKELKSLPFEYREFYTKRLIQILNDSLIIKDQINNDK